MYKIDLVLDNLKWLIGHKTKPNQNLCVFRYRAQSTGAV